MYTYYLYQIYKYFESWYAYMFCRDIELQPLDPREVIMDNDIDSLNRIMNDYKFRKKEYKNS